MPDPGDASALSAAAFALQQSEARLRLMIDAVPAMLTYLDTQQRFLFCNKSYLELLERPADEVLGRDLREVLGDEMHERLQPWLAQIQAGDTARYERQHVRADGSVRDLSVTFVPEKAASGEIVGFFCLTLDVTEVKTLERRLAHLASHDTLTGLPNRAVYDEALAQAAERNKRHRQPFALALLDVDHFKRVNDTHGHAAGDQVLREFARRIRCTLRGADIAARLGGDEFALILEGPIDVANAAGVARKIAEAMRAPFVLDGRTLAITTSVGIAIADDPATLPAQLFARADAALYRAKSAGRDTFVVHA